MVKLDHDFRDMLEEGGKTGTSVKLKGEHLILREGDILAVIED